MVVGCFWQPWHSPLSCQKTHYKLSFFSRLCACTDPPKVVNVVASKRDVAVQQSVSLQCTAEGNPEPTYTWTPCEPQQSVWCHKSTLNVSEVLYDDVYICTVANFLGNDTGNVSVCKLLKNYLQLMYMGCLCHFIGSSIFLTAIIILCTSPVIAYLHAFILAFSLTFPFLKDIHPNYLCASLLCIHFTSNSEQ